jgi:hypothetical protein
MAGMAYQAPGHTRQIRRRASDSKPLGAKQGGDVIPLTMPDLDYPDTVWA